MIGKTWNEEGVSPVISLLKFLQNLGENLDSWKKNVFGKPVKIIRTTLKQIELLEAKPTTDRKMNLLNSKVLELKKIYDAQESIAKQ